jgi:phosphatidylglycerol:prolipoprotein diacylglycerol transferase
MLVISLTYCACVIWVYSRAKKLGLPQGPALDFCLMIMAGGFLGARLFHIFYENWEYYRLFPWDAFKVWRGGFVFYGGFLGALLACWLYARAFKQDFWAWADFFAPVLAIGYVFGRLACFLNGCCFGAHCDLPWAVEFQHPGLPTGPRHPTQLYAALWELFISFPVATWLAPKLEKAKGSIFLAWLISHSMGRLIMEQFRDDHRGAELLGLSVSTWLSLGLLSSALILMLKNRAKNAPN